MALTANQLEQQKKQAEELLFSGPESLGFADSLFFGRFRSDLIFPYPKLSNEEQQICTRAVEQVRKFADEKIDARAIDQQADIPEEVIRGLAELGILGMTAPIELGGKGFNQSQYCQVMEVIGGHCASTAVFVNAHHSIGIRALLLFGTEEQKKKWLPDLIHARKLAAFALTEPMAGSDAGNVQTNAIPTEDGKAFLLTGEKRYITNGGIAGVLTVMARTPSPKNPKETKVTAFLVTPDMPGFEVVEVRAEKCGIRGTATGRLRFTNMRVPRENILGPEGKGLKVALTVLDFGRTTFGASCTGVAKFCIQAASKHALHRVQFQQTLSEFELVKKKIAFMSAHAFAMEATTRQCAAFIDRGAEDYKLETAILKVFATEHLWTIVNDTIQIFGGQAYFNNEPYERLMRDARINTIGEGANDVLKAFIAVVGCRGPGMYLDRLRKSMPKLLAFGFGFLIRSITPIGLPKIPLQSPELHEYGHRLALAIKKLNRILPWVFLKAKTEERFIQSQHQHERLANICIDLYTSSCALSRLDHEIQKKSDSPAVQAEILAGKHFLELANDRIKQNFQFLFNQNDDLTNETADATLKLFQA